MRFFAPTRKSARKQPFFCQNCQKSSIFMRFLIDNFAQDLYSSLVLRNTHVPHFSERENVNGTNSESSDEVGHLPGAGPGDGSVAEADRRGLRLAHRADPPRDEQEGPRALHRPRPAEDQARGKATSRETKAHAGDAGEIGQSELRRQSPARRRAGARRPAPIAHSPWRTRCSTWRSGGGCVPTTHARV